MKSKNKTKSRKMQPYTKMLIDNISEWLDSADVCFARASDESLAYDDYLRCLDEAIKSVDLLKEHLLSVRKLVVFNRPLPF